MKKEMSSFDVGAVVREMSVLADGHLDKAYQTGTDVLLRINTKGAGKADLCFRGGRWLFLSPERPGTDSSPGPFAAYLRQNLANARIGASEQSGSDRTVVTKVYKSDGEYSLVFELFGGGNILLVRDGVIVNCLVQRTFRDRVTRPGQPYVVSKQRFDPFSAGEEEFRDAFRTSDADTVRTLAIVNNLGGQYAEEVCARAGIDKNRPSSGVSDAEISGLYSALRSVIADMRDNPASLVYRKDGRIVDLAPTDLRSHADAEREEMPSLSQAIWRLLSETAAENERERKDPEIEKLRRRILRQRETAAEYREQAELYRARAELLYTEYAKVSELLTVLKEQSARLTWDKLVEGASKITWVSGIDPSRNKVRVIVSDAEIVLDYTKSIDANASALYAAGKDVAQKAQAAEEALKGSEAELAKKETDMDRRRAAAASRAKPTKRFWFESYRWQFTSGGRLIIGGRDAKSNNAVVKKHLKDRDIYAHADIHGAPSVILKDGLSASPDELREVCWFALAHSKAWTAGSPEGGAFWTYPDQVSKTPDAGQFVPKGAFIIRGKRNWEYHIPLEMGIGEIEHEGARKVMCAPVPIIETRCSKYVAIRPSKEKNPHLNGELAKLFQVPEEEISAIVPPGPSAVVRRSVPEPGNGGTGQNGPPLAGEGSGGRTGIRTQV